MTAGHAQPAVQGRRLAVLVTRPEPGASETAGRIRAVGLTPVVAPMLHIASLPVRLGPAVQAILVTSRNALPPLPASLHGLPLLAVGDATAARARAAGFTNVCTGGGDAVALAALAAEVLPSGTALLLATGVGQGASLAADLRQRGFRVHRRAVYATRPARSLPAAARNALADGSLGSAMFLSADTARAFVRALPNGLRPALAGVDALAIGQPTADVLTYLPWRSLRVSAKPTLASVMALL